MHNLTDDAACSVVVSSTCDGKVHETPEAIECLTGGCPCITRVPVLPWSLSVLSKIVAIIALLVPLLLGTLERLALDIGRAERLPLVEKLVVGSEVDGVFKQLDYWGVLELVDGILDPIWVHKVHITVDPRCILPVDWKARKCDIDKVLLHPHDGIGAKLDVQGVRWIGHLVGAASLDALNDDVVHLIVLHTRHKLLEKLGTLLVALRIGHNRNNVKVLTVHLYILDFYFLS